jgi:3-oxoacyl-[acyl-carrier-protein] synthase III
MTGRAAAGRPVTITGLGTYAPERVLSNDELSEFVDTSDEWIRARTGIRERRISAEDELTSDVALSAARKALEDAGVEAGEIDLVIVGTISPDMGFPATAAIVADRLGCGEAAAYDVSAGCTGFMYALAQGHSAVVSGLSRRALVIGADVLSKILDWTDRSTLVLFGDGAGAVVLEATEESGFLSFDVGADGSGGPQLNYPGSGTRPLQQGEKRFLQMNGREVFKFATRVLVSSAEKTLEAAGLTVDDVDLYVPHQANVRIIDHAVRRLGFPEEKVVVNVQRYGNTSSGSIPLALADALRDGRLQPGSIVLMTGMGAGLTWGSAAIRWTHPTKGELS